MGYIDAAHLEKLAHELEQSGYGTYLLKVLSHSVVSSIDNIIG